MCFIPVITFCFFEMRFYKLFLFCKKEKNAIPPALAKEQREEGIGGNSFMWSQWLGVSHLWITTVVAPVIIALFEANSCMLKLSAPGISKRAWRPDVEVRAHLLQRWLEKGAACKRRYSRALRAVSLLRWGRAWGEEKKKKEKKKRKAKKKRKGKKERKNRGKRKNGLSNFLEIVIDNLYLLYYYRVIKIEDVNYIIK
jgi:hypothetical protein